MDDKINEEILHSLLQHNKEEEFEDIEIETDRKGYHIRNAMVSKVINEIRNDIQTHGTRRRRVGKATTTTTKLSAIGGEEVVKSRWTVKNDEFDMSKEVFKRYIHYKKDCRRGDLDSMRTLVGKCSHVEVIVDPTNDDEEEEKEQRWFELFQQPSNAKTMNSEMVKIGVTVGHEPQKIMLKPNSNLFHNQPRNTTDFTIINANHKHQVHNNERKIAQSERLNNLVAAPAPTTPATYSSLLKHSLSHQDNPASTSTAAAAEASTVFSQDALLQLIEEVEVSDSKNKNNSIHSRIFNATNEVVKEDEDEDENVQQTERPAKNIYFYRSSSYDFSPLKSL